MKDISERIATVSALWLDPHNKLRQDTIQALQVSTGLSARHIELSIRNCFEELTLPKISAYLSSLTQSKRSHSTVLHILPSNAFTAWVHGAVTSLLLARRCLLKPSRREPVFAGAWKKSLELIDPGLAERVDVISQAETGIRDSQVVVAYGADETLWKIQSTLPETIRFVGYGHKLSVGIIFQEALHEGLTDELFERVQSDSEPFRLQGCLSPQILYLESALVSQWPALSSSIDVAPKIRPFTEWETLRLELKKFVPFLSCIGYAGPAAKEDFLENELSDYKISRVCPLGQMQRPPLSWRNGGIFLADLLH